MNSSTKIARGDKLPDSDHVLRYVRRKNVDLGDQIVGAAFLARPQERDDGPSVNWLEFFSGEEDAQITAVKAHRRIKYEKRGRLAKLNVGATSEYLRRVGDLNVAFIYDPLPATEGDEKPRFAADPSHAYLKGIPFLDTPEGEAIGDLLAHCILESFPVEPDR